MTQNNEDAVNEFIAVTSEIDAMLSRLRELSADHFGFGPDEIQWGHVGAVKSYAHMLKNITDAAFGEGEHAA
tara:strand:+ start:196 stop:411 length:216 start_codon:yes stop_codon:yes gene_type:complete